MHTETIQASEERVSPIRGDSQLYVVNFYIDIISDEKTLNRFPFIFESAQEYRKWPGAN